MTEQVSFYRDTLKSYMVIRCPEGTAGEGYQYRMLAANHIKGLLDCSLRNIDADSYLYYDITSRQRLSALYTSKKIAAADVRRILGDAANVCQSLADFLLDSSRILLDPEFIFCDLRDGSCAFTYYPENTEETGVLPLLEFMESHLDERDSEASSILYRLLSMAENDGAVLNREILDSVLGTDCEAGYDKESGHVPYEKPEPDQAVWNQPNRPADMENPSEPVPLPKKEQKGFSGKHSGKDILYSIAGIFCVIIGIMLYGVCDLYPEMLGGSAGTLCRAGVFLFPALGAVILVVGRMRKKRGVSASTAAGQNRSDDGQQACIYPSEYPEAFQMTDKTEHGVPDRALYSDTSHQPTVVLRNKDSAQGKLYGTGKALGMQISLDRLPCTIGKMREYASVVLQDGSVSRVHASVSAGEDGQIYIRDLNSTNGTVINGVTLRPDESAAIHPGDEIRIGALSFVYR